MVDEKIKEFLVFSIRRKTTDLTKSFLFIIEDLQAEGYNIPDEKYLRIRKRCLDVLNDSLREINNTLEKLDIKLKD